MIKETKWLPLNIQFFAEEGADDTPDDPPAEAQADAETTETAATPTYTQADIDRIVGERLAREKQKAEKAVEQAKAEAERKKLEEAQEYRALYEKTQAELEQVRTAAKQAELDALKRQLLSEAGFKSEEIAESIDFITGDDEETVKDAVERFKRVAGPRFVDPATTGTGTRRQPESKSADDVAADMYARIKDRIRR